jgi:hypothetical protein
LTIDARLTSAIRNRSSIGAFNRRLVAMDEMLSKAGKVAASADLLQLFSDQFGNIRLREGQAMHLGLLFKRPFVDQLPVLGNVLLQRRERKT